MTLFLVYFKVEKLINTDKKERRRGRKGGKLKHNPFTQK